MGRVVYALRAASRHGPGLFLRYTTLHGQIAWFRFHPELRFFYGEAPNSELPMKDDYKVGYGKPPAATQFGKRPQPIRSSKPGRAIETAVGIAAAINSPMTLMCDGKTVRMYPHEAMLHGLVKSGLQGRVRAIKEFFRECQKAGELQPPVAQQTGSVIFAPKGLPIDLVSRLIRLAGPPPWDPELFEVCQAEYNSDRENIQRLIAEEKARRDG